jgi:murein DD-endopeptidase MepM/ murein hydrolase activator NlpD
MLKRIKRFVLTILILAVLSVIAAYAGYRYFRTNNISSNSYIVEWLTDAESHPDYETVALLRCGNAPFIVPTTGFIGLLWRDASAPYNSSQRHTGIDIFGNGTAGTIPIYAAYDGFLTRKEDWVSTVIIRHNDPLQVGRTIWTYYTHMASRDGSRIYIAEAFPQGTYNQFVRQGTLLGYQGLYNPPFPVALHLHFSIVTTASDGNFNNEAILANTLDPSPYLGIEVNADDATHPVTCRQ